MPSRDDPEKLGFLNLLIIVLSMYAVLTLVLDTFLKLPEEVSRILNWMDNAICCIFLYDFYLRFRAAKSGWRFMRWGWIDLLSSIPFMDQLRIGRLFRLIRLIRVLRAFRNVHQLLRHVFRNKRQGALSSAVIVAVLMVLLSAIAVLQVETDPKSNIKTAGDALWWAFVTITTVGYGDHFPVTGEGRLIAVVLMTVGVGLFGTFTALLSSLFVEQRIEKEVEEEVREEVAERPKDIY